MWPLRPGGTSHQFSSTLEDIQNHVLKGHPGTIKQRGPQPPYKSYTSLLTVVSLYASTRCPPVWPLRPGGTSHQFSSTLEDIQNHVLKGHPGTMRKRGPQPPFYSHYRVFPVLSLYASTRCPPVWPLRPGGTSHQFSSTLEDIQNHVLEGHPGTMRKRGPQPPFYSHYRVFPVLSLYASTRCPPVWPLRPGGTSHQFSSTLEDIQNHVLKGHPGTMRKRGPQPPFYSHYRVFPVLSLYASTRCPPVWPLRPGGTNHQFSSTLEDIQNHVLKGHPGTIKQRGPQPPYKSYTSLLTVVSLYASTRCPPVWPLRPGGTSHQFSSTLEDIQNHVLKGHPGTIK